VTEQLWSDEQLRAFLDEHLIPEARARLEEQLRRDEHLRRRLSDLARDRDQGSHTVGEIWRRSRLSCPTRDELSGFVVGRLAAEARDYIDFHLTVVGCPVCQANLADLASSDPKQQSERRRRLFESSAGRLPTSRKPR
jgi:anti-sigma factor RsiW